MAPSGRQCASYKRARTITSLPPELNHGTAGHDEHAAKEASRCGRLPDRPPPHKLTHHEEEHDVEPKQPAEVDCSVEIDEDSVRDQQARTEDDPPSGCTSEAPADGGVP